MTLQLVLAAHSRMTLLLHRAWRLRHLIDDFEDFLELSQYSYSVQLFSRCRALLDAVHVYSEIFTSDYPTYCAGLGLGGNPTVASWSNLCDAPNFSKPFGLGGDQTPLQKSEASE